MNKRNTKQLKGHIIKYPNTFPKKNKQTKKKRPYNSPSFFFLSKIKIKAISENGFLSERVKKKKKSKME